MRTHSIQFTFKEVFVEAIDVLICIYAGLNNRSALCVMGFDSMLCLSVGSFCFQSILMFDHCYYLSKLDHLMTNVNL